MPPKRKKPTKQSTKKGGARRRLVLDEEEVDDVAAKKPHEVIDLVNTGPVKKRDFSALSSPTKQQQQQTKRAKAAAFVTPTKKSQVEQEEEEEDEEKKQEEEKEKPYVPTHIHQNVGYLRKGHAQIDDTTKSAFALIQEHFVIPPDLEQNRKYGPLSGTCYEELVLRAYTMGMLEPAHPESDGVQICTACATTGHERNDCPQLI